jgi:hypothetical protein
MAATSIALSGLQQGIVAQPGTGMTGIFTLTPGTTATAGEDITALLTPYFSTIESIEEAGCSAVAIRTATTGGIPVFQFTAGGALATYAVKIFWMTEALAIDNAHDFSSNGTVQIVVTGKAA